MTKVNTITGTSFFPLSALITPTSEPHGRYPGYTCDTGRTFLQILLSSLSVTSSFHLSGSMHICKD